MPRSAVVQTFIFQEDAEMWYNVYKQTHWRADTLDDKRKMLRHFLAALAYRVQKAVGDAPHGFASFRVTPGVRTPHQIVWHMTGVLGYARTFFVGGTWRPPMLQDFDQGDE